MISLRDRLGIGMVATVIVVFVAQWLLVTTAISAVVERYVESRLGHDADSVIAAVDVQSGGAQLRLANTVGAIYQQPLSGHYFRVASPQSVERSRSLWDQDLVVPLLAPGESQTLALDGPRQQPLLAVVRGVSKQSVPLTVVVAEDLGPLQADLRQFKRLYLTVSLAALLALMLLQRIGLRWGLAPLQAVERSLQDLRLGRVRRLEAEVPQEIRPLQAEINRLLESLSRRLSLSRNAVGNLAHGLKTPLSLLVRLGEDRNESTPAAVRQQLTRHTAAIQQLIERELRRAQLAGGNSVGDQFQPDADLRELAGIMARVHQRGLDIALDLGVRGAVPFDRQDMLELMGNVLDNACKWARQRVQVRAHTDSIFRVSIEDDGPGCSLEDRERLGQRGVRLDESTAGHGLGLSIASDVVQLYGGQLRFTASETLGGLRVDIELPLAVDPPSP